jgi:hypothetical protein
VRLARAAIEDALSPRGLSPRCCASIELTGGLASLAARS